MKSLKLIGTLLLAILTTFAVSTGAWAKKGGKPGETTTMGELDGQTIISWSLGTSNKNQARNACVNSGTFDVNGSDFIKVDFTRID